MNTISENPAFPTELRSRRQWICFDVWAESGKSKMSKLPRNPETGGMASSSDPSTWTTYETALTAVKGGRHTALGFVLTEDTGLAILDLENCVDGGEIAEWAAREVQTLDSFTEVSVSGTGLHVLAWGSIPSNLNRQSVQAELWDRDKMFALTGLTVPGQDVVEHRSRELLDVHRRIEGGEFGPDHVLKPILLDQHSQKFRETAADNWAGHYDSRSAAVQGVLCSLAQTYGGDPEVIRAEFEKLPLCDAWVDASGRSKWERLADKEIRKAVSFIISEQAKERAAQRATTMDASPPSDKVTFTRPAVQGRMQDYVLKASPELGEFSGWLPRGSISMIGGSSGAGKTTLIVDVLDRQTRRETVFGHEGAGLPYLIIFADRGGFQNAETFKRMRLDGDRVPHTHLRPVFGVEAAVRICHAIEAQPVVPGVVFVEGADTLVEDPNRPAMVTAFMSALQKIAEHYHVALVLSVGAPKTKPNEQYALKRDRVYGSQLWPRMSATIIILSQIPESGIREVHVEHRNADAETFELEFQNGRLVQRQARAEGVDPLRAWIEGLRDGEEWFTRTQAVAAMVAAGADMGRSSVYDRVKAWLHEGKLEKRWDATRKVEQLRVLRSDAERKARLEPAADVGFAGIVGTEVM